MGDIIWNSTADVKSSTHWYGKYQPRKKVAILSTKQFGVNLIIKVSQDGTMFKPDLMPHNIAISMNGVLALSLEQWYDILATIEHAKQYIDMMSKT